jgi:hypothetical protein
MRSRPFTLAAAGSLLAGVGLGASRSNPVEATLLGAAGVVLAGAFVGIAVGLSDPEVPRYDYAAVGSTLVVLSIFGLVLLGNRPESGYLAALGGGVGAALVGLDSGLKRAGRNEPSTAGRGPANSERDV